MSELSDEAAAAAGVTTRHERMPNGESRYRLVADDGSSYIRTVASPHGAWQRSHHHRRVLETYIVQRGWIALVQLVGDELDWHILGPGQTFTTQVGVAHNVYLPGDAVVHTVKHGTSPDADWHESPELDARTQTLSEADVRRHGPDA